MINNRLKLSDIEIAGMVQGLATFEEMVTLAQVLQAVEVDPTDDNFIDCAAEGMADYIVSGNMSCRNTKAS